MSWLFINNIHDDVRVINYRSGTVNLNTVNSKFHLIQSFRKDSVKCFPIISCLKCTVNSNFHLIQSKTLPTNDFELTVSDLYNIHLNLLIFLNCRHRSVILSTGGGGGDINFTHTFICTNTYSQ